MKKLVIPIKANKKKAPLDKYAGEWVAFADGKVVAHEGTLKGLMTKVRKLKKIKKPSVLLVPKEKEAPCIL